MKQSYIYILASKKMARFTYELNSDLVKRVYEHKNNVTKGFTEKYHEHSLVYYEVFDDIYEAIVREKLLKKWERAWKIRLIEKVNPQWRDLYHDICS